MGSVIVNGVEQERSGQSERSHTFEPWAIFELLTKEREARADDRRAARDFLAELLDICEDRYDTVDDSNGCPRPNVWMCLGGRITEWLDTH